MTNLDFLVTCISVHLNHFFILKIGDSVRLSEKKRSSTPDVLKSRTRLSSDVSVPECEEDVENADPDTADHSPVVSFVFTSLRWFRCAINNVHIVSLSYSNYLLHQSWITSIS